MIRVAVFAAAVVAVLPVAACSSSGGAAPSESRQRQTGTATTSATVAAPTSRAAQAVKCSQLAGREVPAALSAAPCVQPGAADVGFQSYPCSAGGSWYWVSPESADGSDMAPLVGRPGGTWRRAGLDDDSGRLARLAGC